MTPNHTPAGAPVDILLISVTDVETRAVLDVFQEQGGPAARRHLGDKTYYDLGDVAGARVWLARSEMGAGGPGGVLFTVAEAIEQLQPTALLMVGIAFGLQPTRQQLGDVLVARQVMDYGPQRIGTDAAGTPTVVARGDRAGAAVRLLDRCRDAVLDWAEPPQVHVGLLLSGEKLIDHAPLVRWLVQLEPEAIGGDMESAGLYAAAARRKVDWIVIKAISDWADGQKAQDQQARQRLAARNAAGFALHVLRRGGLGAPAMSRRAPEPATAEPAHLRPAALPASDTRLFGRERELQELTTLLRQPDVRAVTITGPGGVGKTSLARQVARALQPVFRDGVAWVALETVQNPALLWPAVVQALQLSEAADSSAEQVVRATLQECALLLVLDTFEHLIGASAAVEQVLADAPGLKLLITSQIGPPFAARTQRRFALEPLEVPPDPAEPDLARLAAYPAVALFADCAARIDRSFQLSAANAADVVALCRLLNGLPLAIELVSSRINAYSPTELCRAITRPELFAAPAPAEQQPRHQSLQQLFDWSYRLLDPAEQRLIARLAIFPGGFTHASAGAVCLIAEPPEAIGPALASLVNKSFIQRAVDQDGASRFSMLKLIRTYATAHQDPHERELLRVRFSAYFTGLVDDANRQLHTPEQPVWVARLDQEIDNLREVLRWELQHGDSAQMVRLAVALEDFWSIRGYLTEGCLWLNEASRHLERYPPQLQAQICASLGMLLARQSDYARSRLLFAHSLSIWQRLQDLDEIAPVIENFGTIANQQADYEQAQQYYQQALEIYRSAGNLPGMAGIILQQGAVALDSGDLTRAEQVLAQVLEQQPADSEQTALALTNLGRTAMYLGDLARSRLLLEEGLALWERLMHRQGRAGALIYLAATARREGRLEEAAGLCRQSRALFDSLGDPVGVAEALEEQAHLALAQADARQAARLLGAVELLRQRAGVRRPAVEQPGYDELLARVQVALGEAACEQARQAGRLLAMRPRAAWADEL